MCPGLSAAVAVSVMVHGKMDGTQHEPIENHCTSDIPNTLDTWTHWNKIIIALILP